MRIASFRNRVQQFAREQQSARFIERLAVCVIHNRAGFIPHGVGHDGQFARNHRAGFLVQHFHGGVRIGHGRAGFIHHQPVLLRFAGGFGGFAIIAARAAAAGRLFFFLRRLGRHDIEERQPRARVIAHAGDDNRRHAHLHVVLVADGIILAHHKLGCAMPHGHRRIDGPARVRLCRNGPHGDIPAVHGMLVLHDGDGKARVVQHIIVRHVRRKADGDGVGARLGEREGNLLAVLGGGENEFSLFRHILLALQGDLRREAVRRVQAEAGLPLPRARGGVYAQVRAREGGEGFDQVILRGGKGVLCG